MEAADERTGPIAPIDARLAHWAGDPDGRLRAGRQALVLAGMYVVFIATYVSINLFSAGRAAHVLYLPGEERVPLLPIFEYLYLLTYFVGVVVVLTVHDVERFHRLLRATALSLLVAYATYLVFPVYLERPRLEVTSLHSWLLSLEYLDGRYNNFPSLHVTLSWLAVHAAQVSRPTRSWLAIVATGISISTLFVRQHYVADVVYGFVLAWVAWRVSRIRPS